MSFRQAIIGGYLNTFYWRALYVGYVLFDQQPALVIPLRLRLRLDKTTVRPSVCRVLRLKASAYSAADWGNAMLVCHTVHPISVGACKQYRVRWFILQPIAVAQHCKVVPAKFREKVFNKLYQSFRGPLQALRLTATTGTSSLVLSWDIHCTVDRPNRQDSSWSITLMAMAMDDH